MDNEAKKYETAVSFRCALEDRLKNIARNKGVPLDRLRRQITFDRLLARLFCDQVAEKPQWLLKGGYALEFRFREIARTTKDIDFTIPHISNMDEERIRELLQKDARKNIEDWFEFYISSAMREFDQAVYGGWRYPVEARVAGRTFVKFHIDVGIGDAVVSDAEWKTGEEYLSFAGIRPAHVAMLPVAQHFAEKIHAYTYPRDIRPFSRIRDLVDIVLLIEQGLPDPETVMTAITATFERRKTHAIPDELEAPPSETKDSYQKMAEDCGVNKKSMQEAVQLLDAFWRELTK